VDQNGPAQTRHKRLSSALSPLALVLQPAFMILVCPRCGAALPGHGGIRCVPLGRALALIGGLALVAAYFMPWLGVQVGNQGIILSGDFLGRFLGSNSDLRRFIPGSSGEPSEAQLLRALVYLFPASGALAALLAILGTLRPGLGGLLNLALALVGLVPLVALVLAVPRLPAGATQELGLRVIGAGCIAVLIGAALDVQRPKSHIQNRV
jgi:hypothetical protein